MSTTVYDVQIRIDGHLSLIGTYHTHAEAAYEARITPTQDGERAVVVPREVTHVVQPFSPRGQMPSIYVNGVNAALLLADRIARLDGWNATVLPISEDREPPFETGTAAIHAQQNERYDVALYESHVRGR